jgi:hypothetical protein
MDIVLNPLPVKTRASDSILFRIHNKISSPPFIDVVILLNIILLLFVIFFTGSSQYAPSESLSLIYFVVVLGIVWFLPGESLAYFVFRLRMYLSRDNDFRKHLRWNAFISLVIFVYSIFYLLGHTEGWRRDGGILVAIWLVPAIIVFNFIAMKTFNWRYINRMRYQMAELGYLNLLFLIVNLLYLTSQFLG